MSQIESIKIKKLGDNKNVDLDLELSTIENFINNPTKEIIKSLELHMGNKSDECDEYFIIDSDFAFLDEAGIDKDHILNLSDFLEFDEMVQNVNKEEVFKGYVTIPNETDYKCIIVNIKSDSYILVSEKDIKDIIVGFYTTEYADLKKTKGNTKSLKEVISEVEINEEDDELIVPLDENLDENLDEDLTKDSDFSR